MPHAFVSVGSNINPEENIDAALRLIAERTDIRAVSTVFLTEPIGPSDQPAYYNCVIDIVTDLPPLSLKKEVLRGIEARLGRVRAGNKYAPRTIDLDLILYDTVVMSEDELVLPDPDIGKRPFLAAGLAELAPGMFLPGAETSIGEVAARLPRQGMTPLPDYTGKLRKDVLNERKQ